MLSNPNTVPRTICLAFALAAPLLACRSSTTTNPRSYSSRSPSSIQRAQAHSTSEPPRPSRNDDSSFVCPKWTRLGQRNEFFLTPHVKRSKPGFGSQAPFSIRLPEPATIAPWLLSRGISPECEADSSVCLSTPTRIFAQDTRIPIYGTNPRSSPIRVATIWLKIEPISPEELQKIDQVSPNCLIGAGRINPQGEFPQELSQRDYSPKRGECIAQASDLGSWVDGGPQLHYFSLMRSKLHPRGYIQQAAIIFVVDEPDWSVLEELVRASAESFQVDWSRFADRITSTLWDQPLP